MKPHRGSDVFKDELTYSLVTAVLPAPSRSRVVDALSNEAGTSPLLWDARGTLLHDHWLKRYFPPISPAKSMLQLLVPNEAVELVENTIVESSRLHQQSTGAVFSTPCDHAYFGSEFSAWQSEQRRSTGGATALSEKLCAIYCIVAPNNSERVAKAAIRAGTHGPVVYYSEGRGLRDRLGWLRITKEHDKEVLLVVTEEDDADMVFDSMAKAGELHLPGRGFMYSMQIDKGVFNLPSRVSHHHYEANMHQIINAIDHLSGHTHWRDQTAFDAGQGRGVGLNIETSARQLPDQVVLSAIIPRSLDQGIIDIMLDAGAPGLNISHARFAAEADSADSVQATGLNEEYTLLRCITAARMAQSICEIVDDQAEAQGLSNLCMYVNRAPRVATYIPGTVDYREKEGVFSAA